MRIAYVAILAIVWTGSLQAQVKLPVHWEELTAEDFVTAIHESQATCVLPLGILAHCHGLYPRPPRAGA